VHALLALCAVWLTTGHSATAPVVMAAEPARLVFLMSPGPGGGGGGSGNRRPTPARRLERRGRAPVSVPTASPEPVLSSREAERPAPAAPRPDPVEPPPEVLAARTVVAPVLVTAAATSEQEGTTDSSTTDTSTGPGAGGKAGAGRGAGSGPGLGSGIGEGAGGGTGGGPYRPGSGIEAPRLLHEVKAVYTEDARKRGLTGEVVLEIVVRRDGTVGEVTVRRGIGAGLDERAVAAVRQWRFAPARRQGEPVDVVVEVAVDFTLR
jgi:TonB family protein